MRTFAIGIDIGGTRTKLGLVDLEAGSVIDTLIRPTETNDAQAFQQLIGEAITAFAQIARDQQVPLLGVGIGVSSFVFADGTVDSTYGFMDFLDDYPLATLVENQYGLPCRVDNDARLVALGEARYGQGKGIDRVLVLTLGTGLGIGFVVSGQLDGKQPYGHMAGHMTITQNDVVCYCGRTGCLESLVSATGLVEAAERANWIQNHPERILTAEAIFKASEVGDLDATALIREFLAHLRTGIDNYINLYAPDRIVLGGGVAKGLRPYLSQLHTPRLLGPYKRYQTTLALSELEEQAGILGSAALFW